MNRQGKVPVDFAALGNLAELARRNGTLDGFATVALEWAGAANTEIGRLRAAQEQAHADYRVQNDAIIRLQDQLEQVRTEQHRGEAERHQLRKEIGEALGDLTRARAERDAWVRIARALEPLVLAVNEAARDGAAHPLTLISHIERLRHEATLFAQGEGTKYWPMLAGAAPPETICITPVRADRAMWCTLCHQIVPRETVNGVFHTTPGGAYCGPVEPLDPDAAGGTR